MQNQMVVESCNGHATFTYDVGCNCMASSAHLDPTSNSSIQVMLHWALAVGTTLHCIVGQWSRRFDIIRTLLI